MAQVKGPIPSSLPPSQPSTLLSPFFASPLPLVSCLPPFPSSSPPSPGSSNGGGMDAGGGAASPLFVSTGSFEKHRIVAFWFTGPCPACGPSGRRLDCLAVRAVCGPSGRRLGHAMICTGRTGLRETSVRRMLLLLLLPAASRISGWVLPLLLHLRVWRPASPCVCECDGSLCVLSILPAGLFVLLIVPLRLSLPLLMKAAEAL